VIWDCIMLRDELDMLQMRLEETDGLDIVTVAVEATRDHQGHPKRLHLRENWDRFAPWGHRLRYLLTSLPDDPNPWVREHYQRDRALAALKNADPGDLLLIADVDEIPSRDVFSVRPEPAACLEQMVCAFAVDWLWQPDPTSVLTTVGHARSVGSLAAVRDNRMAYPRLRDAGWHFSWVGGPQACMEKLDAFCHLEAKNVVREGIESGDFIERGLWNVARLVPVDVDERWPTMIRERRCPESWFRPRPPASATSVPS
jgi:hypothetical protein